MEVYSREYLAQQELRKSGLSQESIMTVQTATTNNTPVTGTDDNALIKLIRQLQEQQQLFTRFKQHADTRILKLETQLTTTTKILAELQQTIMTMKSNKQASQMREQILNHEEKEPADKPIDRNKVAPKDVQIEKIFYYANL